MGKNDSGLSDIFVVVVAVAVVVADAIAVVVDVDFVVVVVVNAPRGGRRCRYVSCLLTGHRGRSSHFVITYIVVEVLNAYGVEMEEMWITVSYLNEAVD